MELNKYQEQAMKTCMASSKNFAYMMLNLVGEVGEFASKVAKQIRKQNITIGNYISVRDDPGSYNEWLGNQEELQKEAGDILWQLAGLCSVMGWRLEDIARQNLDKLADRQRRNKIDGEGDNR